MYFLTSNIEKHYHCFSYDYVRIYNGDTITADNLLGELTGDDYSTDCILSSNGPIVTINFVSDSVVRKNGFSIQYDAG